MDYNQTAATLAGVIKDDDQHQLRLLAQLTLKRAVVDDVHADLLMAYVMGASAALGDRLDVDLIRAAIGQQSAPMLVAEALPMVCPACGCATEVVSEERTNGTVMVTRCTRKLFTGCL